MWTRRTPQGQGKDLQQRNEASLARGKSVDEQAQTGILDEPTGGLDVLQSYHVREIIKKYVAQHGVTILLSSHNMLEVEHLCSTVALLDKGKIVVEGKPQKLKEKYQTVNLEEVFAKVVGFA